MKVVSTILSVIALGVIGYFSFMSYLSSQMSDSSINTWETMDTAEFDCPDGLEVKTERWSKLGYSRSCVQPLHGKWEAWSEGYKHIDGSYDHGKEDGVWIFYRADGSISKKIEYRQGKELGLETAVREGRK